MKFQGGLRVLQEACSEIHKVLNNLREVSGDIGEDSESLRSIQEGLQKNVEKSLSGFHETLIIQHGILKELWTYSLNPF